MRILITILAFGLLTGFQLIQEKDLDSFVKTQLDNYKIIQTFKTGYFVNSIENNRLHSRKREIALEAKKSHSNKNSYNKSVFSRIQMWQFDFESIEKRNQAYDSLLNCFPYDCAKIQKPIDQAIKITPSIWVLSGKSILIARINCEQEDQKWSTFKKEFANYFAENETKFIVTDCGKLTWKTKNEIKSLP